MFARLELCTSSRTGACKPAWRLFDDGFCPSVSSHSMATLSLQPQSFLGCMRKPTGVDCRGAKTLKPNSTWELLAVSPHWDFSEKLEEAIAWECPPAWAMAISAGTIYLCDAKMTQYWCDNSLKRAMVADRTRSGQNKPGNGCSQIT